MDYGKKYMANSDRATQLTFNKIVSDLRVDMSLESAVSEALRQMRGNQKLGGLIGKPLGPGGKK